MAGLSPPTIWEPLYECTPIVVVTGYVPGANVKIYASLPPGGLVGGGVSFAPGGQTFGVDAAKMKKGTVIWATQTYGGETSPDSPKVTLQTVLGGVQPPLLIPPLLECALCLRAYGVIPGATVRMKDGATEVGNAIAGWGAADVGLSPAAAPNHTLTALHTHCGADGPLTTPGLKVTPVLRGPALTLPTPSIRQPVYACEPFAVVEGCLPGCRVELWREGKAVASACAAGTEIALWVPDGLGEGQGLRARQTRCGEKGEPLLEVWSWPEVKVQSAKGIPQPAILPPLWAGAPTVQVAMTVAGEVVTIEADGTPIGKGGAGGSLTLLNVAPSLDGGQNITATVELCGVSKKSVPVPVGVYPYAVEAPEVQPPLWACAPAVTVNKCVPGATVSVNAKKGSDTVLLGTAAAFGGSVVVGVIPPLQKDWKVTAQQRVGATWSDFSPAVDVQAFGTPKPPRLRGPLSECARCVAVESVVPGAHVDVYQDGAWVGGTFASAAKIEVPVYPPLTESAKANVTVRQTLCGQASGPSDAAAVGPTPALPQPKIWNAHVGQTAVTVNDVVPGATVEIEEGTFYPGLVIGEACVTESPATVGLSVPLSTGAFVRARQRLCNYVAESQTYTKVTPPPEWPLAPGPFQAGFRLVADIPISGEIGFLEAGSPGGTPGVDFWKRPEKNVAVVHYPAAAAGQNAPFAAGGPFPLVIFGHAKRSGGGGLCPGTPEQVKDATQDFRRLSHVLDHLATWGFVTIAPDLDWLTISGESDRRFAMQDAGHYMLVKNVEPGSPFEGQIKTTGMGVMGHSFGGFGAVVLGTSGALPIGAMVLIAPAGGTATVPAFAPRPVLVLHGTKDTAEVGAGTLPLSLYAAAGPKKHLLTIGGANHFGYTDDICIVFDPTATISQPTQKKIARAYVTAFFRRYLQGATEEDPYLVGVKIVEELEGLALSVQAQL